MKNINTNIDLKSASRKKIIKGIIVPVCLLMLWTIISKTGVVSEFIFPGPEKVIYTLIDLFTHENMIFDIGKSFSRVLQGFLLGSFAGFIIGSLMGAFKTGEKLLGPVFHIYRQVPVVGWLPIILLWFGTSDMVKVIFIAMGAFTPTVLNTFTGIRGVPVQLVEVAEVFGFSRLKTFFRVILPSAVPSISIGAKVALNLSWMFVIAAEIMTYSTGGLGFLLDGARDNFRMDILLAGILVIFVIGFLMNYIVEKLQEFCLSYRS